MQEIIYAVIIAVIGFVFGGYVVKEKNEKKKLQQTVKMAEKKNEIASNITPAMRSKWMRKW